jgi:5-methyltetrahydropteroyltriglutamate--homocysteine methyltransferase
MAYLWALAQAATQRPVKAGVGAGPAQLSGLVHFVDGPVKDRFALSAALAELFNAELLDLQDAGCSYIQYEDLGAWTPNLTGDADFPWVCDTVNRVMRDVHVHKAWHFCLGNAWGNRLDALVQGGYAKVLPHYFEVDVDEFVLDFACREMADASLLRDVPKEYRVGIGVIDVRNLEVEQPDQVAERIRTVLEHVDAERVTLTTDCGMKQLPRPVARAKLRSLTAGAAIVRSELTGERP